MAGLFASAAIVDLILLLVVVEAAALAGYFFATRRGIAPLDFAGNLAAGAFLLLALRAAIVGAWWGWIAAPLAAALAAHVFDLVRRWRTPT